MQRPFSSPFAESEVTPVRFTAFEVQPDIFFFDVPDGSLELCPPSPWDASGQHELDADPLRFRGGSSALDGGAPSLREGQIRSASEDEYANRWADHRVAETTLRHVLGAWDRVTGMDPQRNLPHRDLDPQRLPGDARPPLFLSLFREAELAPRDGNTGA
jgi:hypothetical protein